MKTRTIFKNTSLDSFNIHFSDEDSCYKYLSEIKWEEGGFKCKKCGNTHYCKGQQTYSRRCTRCKHDDSPTAGTAFDKIKFSILTAFHIAFDLCITENGVPSTALSKKYGIRQKTVWNFKRKIQRVMYHQTSEPLVGTVLVGTFNLLNRQTAQSRSTAILALEVLDNGRVGKALAQVITESQPEAMTDFLQLHISKNSKVYVTDEICKPFMNDFHYETLESGNTTYIALLDNHISSLKNWLYGVHRRCSDEHIQCYLNEYCFRFNGSSCKRLLFDSLIGLMVSNMPLR